MVQNGDQKMFVELKGVRKLLSDLPNAIDELQKHRGSIRVAVMVVAVPHSLLHKNKTNTKTKQKKNEQKYLLKLMPK